MQNVLPVSGQNSHLFTIVAQGKIVLYFAYADYEQNTSISEHSSFPLPVDFDMTMFDSIMEDIVVTWGSDIGLDLRTDSSGIINAIFFQSTKIGGASLIVDSSYYQDGYRSRILNCIAERFGEEERLKYATDYMRTFKPSDLLWVSLDWDKFSVFHIRRLGGVDSVDVDVKEFSIETSFLHNDTANQLQNVIGIHLEKDSIRNILANVIQKRIMTSTSSEVWDVIRSYVTTSLIKIKDQVLKDFGMKTGDAHLLITGNLSAVLSPETLFISVIDGLQLRGRYRVILDQDQLSTILGNSLESKSFAIPVGDIYKNRFLYVSTEADVRAHDGDMAFKGTIENNVGEEGKSEREIIGQVGYFHTFDVGGTGRVMMDPTNLVYFPNLSREGRFMIASFANNDDKVVIDCRKIPVVYGPDEGANLQRIKVWINGLNLRES